MEKLIMAYDFGTSGVKAALIDTNGNLLAYEEEGYPLYSEKVGYAEQDPADYWSAVCTATKRLMERTRTDREAVAALCYSTQGLGIIPVDQAGNTLYNNIIWVDSRAGEQAKEINEKIGCEVVGASSHIAKMRWYKVNVPEAYEKTYMFLDCTGYLNYKTTGVFSLDYGSGFYSPNPERQKYVQSIFSAAGIDLDKFPPLIPSSGYVGKVTPKAAEEMGLSVNTSVYMGLVDSAAACVGAGCCREGAAHVYLGSSGWVRAMLGKEYLPELSTGVYQYPGLNPDAMCYGGDVQSACLAFNWAIGCFYAKEKEELGGDIYPLIEREVTDVPAGSGGILATPWIMGECCPIQDEKAKGVFLGVSNHTKRADMVNAVMESVAYSLRAQMEYYRHDTGKWPDHCNAIGGGTLSDHWVQMIADVLDMPVKRTKNCRHAGAFGAAATAAVGMGLFKADETDQYIHIDQTFTPIQENVAVYKGYYAAWEKIYPAVKDLFADLTGLRGENE